VAIEIKLAGRDLNREVAGGEVAGGEVEGLIQMALGRGFILPVLADGVQRAFGGDGQVAAVIAPVQPGIVPVQAVARTKGLRSTPSPVSSTSTTSPCTRSGEVPSVPIQITSPGYKVRYFVISAI